VVASQDGLDFYRRIAEVYPLLRRRHAPAAGIPSLVVEVGHQQAQAVRKLIDGKGHGRERADSQTHACNTIEGP
jgi:methylase of polypeptide subunit release factors